MFAEPPPALEAPAITAQQQSDLDCLSIGAVLANATHNAGPNPWAARLVRVYLGRLRGSDPSREWLQMTIPESAMSYGWFLGRLRDCQRPLRPAVPRPPATQAAPLPQPPPQPTGG
jgi:hypothetical protein